MGPPQAPMVPPSSIAATATTSRPVGPVGRPMTPPPQASTPYNIQVIEVGLSPLLEQKKLHLTNVTFEYFSRCSGIRANFGRGTRWRRPLPLCRATITPPDLNKITPDTLATGSHHQGCHSHGSRGSTSQPRSGRKDSACNIAVRDRIGRKFRCAICLHRSAAMFTAYAGTTNGFLSWRVATRGWQMPLVIR